MKVLGIETSTRVGTLALVEGQKVLAEEVISENLRHAGHFEQSLRNLFSKASLLEKDLDAIAVGLGPGSFTGIRIGLTMAKAFAFALHKPLWGVGTLDVLVHASNFKFQTLCPVISGEAQEVYGGLFEKSQGMMTKTFQEFSLPVSNLKNMFEKPVFFFGPALEKHRLIFENLFENQYLDYLTVFPKASSVAILAQDSKWRLEGMDIVPRYVKAPYAGV